MCATCLETLRPWFELAYFASGPLLLIGLYITYRQLIQSKEDTDIRYEREAIAAALDQCRALQIFLERAPEQCKAVFTTPLAPRDVALRDDRFEMTSLPDGKAAMTWLTELGKNVGNLNQAIVVCNQLEGFAMPFIRGVADELAAYQAMAPAYCALVRRFSPLLIVLPIGGMRDSVTNEPIASGPFANAKALYGVWSNRAEKERLDTGAKQLADKSSQIKIPVFRPLGVD